MKRLLATSSLFLMLIGCKAGMLNSGGWEPEPQGPSSAKSEGSQVAKRMVRAGDALPSFSVSDQYDRTVRSEELNLGKGAVLVFVPRDDEQNSRTVYTWAKGNSGILDRQGIELLLVVPHNSVTARNAGQREGLRVAMLADEKGNVGRSMGFHNAPTEPYTVAVSDGRIQVSEKGLISGSDLIISTMTKPGDRREGLFQDLFSE